MIDSSKSKEFISLLDQTLQDSFFNSRLARETREKKNKIIIAGRNFISSLEELDSLEVPGVNEIVPHRYYNEEHATLLNKILECGILVLGSPNDKKAQDNLAVEVNYLKELMASNYGSNATRSIFSILGNSFKAVVGAGLTSAGLLILTDLAFSLPVIAATGPVGIVGALLIGIAATIIGVILTAYAIHQIHENGRLVLDKQIKEIEAFVELVAPNSSVQNSQEPISQQQAYYNQQRSEYSQQHTGQQYPNIYPQQMFYQPSYPQQQQPMQNANMAFNF
ncbi:MULTISPECIES: YdbT family protein [Legionella]|uniref:Uncharacterized protein n=1 Tax=Legionella septentrionalis TaxID=2498109 RepID=A0A433JIU7_9GAMM|nr:MULTISPECIES: hypothetical protein [Legionella]MCP0913357.1 hypothetical protein [Legionella sp. 27cVA30]RUQ85080.1 hypothetical protein EKM59_07600 [Legionella septentrionalis]RUQ95177.1 hypothetical protein ELY11_09680 [Legionella septentrionalis]RUR08636.1 hypothetical protein ELY14_11015 [Legionella septentrionalis]RUR14871.1 hypothetical protein ELY10_07325 [Legionella septentrionalis]